MDRKSIALLAGSVLALFLLSRAVDYFYPPIPAPVVSTAMATNKAGGITPGAGTNRTDAVPSIVTTPSPASTPVTTPAAQPNQPEQILTVSNKDLVFQFTSYGGGLKSVALSHYSAVVSRSHQMPDESNYLVLNLRAPTPVLTVQGENAQGDNVFTLSRSNDVVRAEKTLPNGLQLIKEFNVGDSGTNFLFSGKLRFVNTTSAPLRIPAHEVVVETATPSSPLDDPTTIGSIWYNGAKSVDIGGTYFANRTLGCFPGTPKTEFADGASNVVWVAAHNQFFAFAAIPTQPAPGVRIHSVWLPAPETNGLPSAPNAALLTNGCETALTYPALILEPGKPLEREYTFYAGPKEYNGLAKIGASMGNKLDLVMGFSGFLGFGFFSKMLLLSMNGLNAIGLPYGLCIIAITVIVKLIFWPLTAASTRSQKRMQALQPQIAAIAEKYKDDPLKKHEKTQEFYKEQKINPMGSCLPMLIQIPVFFGFYSMLRNAIELRGVPFLWAPDLSLPDTVTFVAGFPINPLPLIMGASQLWQAHLTPPSPGMDPGQQKMMRWMPLLFIMFFYKMSSGLTVYWTVSNLLTIAQTKMTRMAAEPTPKPALATVVRKKK